MSFTLAHPVAAIPLRKPLGSAGVLSALVIGSMVPDFAMLRFLHLHRDHGHSPFGLIWFCLPFGVLCYVIFHGLCRPVATFALPQSIRRRVPPPPRSGWLPDHPWWAVSISILVGAATHLVWDAFTHRDEFFVQRLPPLRALLFKIDGASIYTYRLLQHGGTLLGVGILAVWTWRWFVTTPPRTEEIGWQPPSGWRWLIVMGLVLPAAIGGTSYGLMCIGKEAGLASLRGFLYFASIASMSILAPTWVGMGVLWRLAERRLQKRLTP